MVIYEVNLQIERKVYDKYMQWLEPHVEQMLTFHGFNKAVYLYEKRVENDNDDANRVTIQYHIDSLKDLDDYLVKHAKEMRDDGIKKFPGQFKATRRFFEVFKEISASKTNYAENLKL